MPLPQYKAVAAPRFETGGYDGFIQMGQNIQDRDMKDKLLQSQQAQQNIENKRADALLTLQQNKDAREVQSEKALAAYNQQLGRYGKDIVTQAQSDKILQAYNANPNADVVGMQNQAMAEYNKSPQQQMDLLRNVAPPMDGMNGRDMLLAQKSALEPREALLAREFQLDSDAANKIFQQVRDEIGYEKAKEAEERRRIHEIALVDKRIAAENEQYTQEQNSKSVEMSKWDRETNTINTVKVPQGQVGTFQANGFSLGGTKPGPRSTDGANDKGTNTAKQYDALKETIAKDYGIFDTKGALEIVEELQANGIHPDVVKDVMRKSSAGSLFDNTFTYKDLNENMPMMYDADNNAKGYGDILKQAKEEGKVIVLSDDKKHYSMVDKTKAKVDVNKVTDNNTTVPVVEKPKEPVNKAKETQNKMQSLYDAATTQEEKNAIFNDSIAIQRAESIRNGMHLGPRTESDKARELAINNFIKNGVASVAETIKGFPNKQRTVEQMLFNLGSQQTDDSQYTQKSPTGNPAAYITYK